MKQVKNFNFLHINVPFQICNESAWHNIPLKQPPVRVSLPIAC